MSEWREVTLGTLVQVKHGFAFRSEFFQDSGDLIVLTPGNFNETGGFKPKAGKEKYYGGPVPRGYLLTKGDVVIAMTEQSMGLLGSSATVPESNRYLHNQRLGLVNILDGEALDTRFAYHLFNSSEVRKQIQATATGAKIRHTAPERIGNVVVRVPSLRSQRLVAAVLDSIDDLIDNNRRRIELLEQMVQSIYREWFSDFRYPGHEYDELVDSRVGRIPARWSVRAATELLDLDKGVSYKGVFLEDSGTPMINLKCFGRTGGFRFDALKGYSGPVKPRHVVRAGDLVMANTDLTQAGSIIGRVATVPLVRGFDELIVSHHVFAVRPKSIPSLFLFHALSQTRFRDHARATASGTTVLGLKREDVLSYPMLEPPHSLIDAFVEVASDIQDSQVRYGDTNRSLERMRSVLLPRLIAGAIDIAHLDLDAVLDGTAA